MTALLSKLETLAQEVGVDVVELWDKFVAFVKAEIAHKKETSSQVGTPAPEQPITPPSAGV